MLFFENVIVYLWYVRNKKKSLFLILCISKYDNEFVHFALNITRSGTERIYSSCIDELFFCFCLKEHA